MKNFLIAIAFISVIIFSPPEAYSQRDVNKTISVLNLPEPFAVADGLVTQIQAGASIVVDRTIDKTKRPADTTEVYKLVPTTTSQSVSFYSLNYWDGRLSNSNFTQSAPYTFERPAFTSPLTKAWHPQIKYEISPDGKSVKETRNIGQNVVVVRTRQGLRWIQTPVQTDYNNPPVAVTVVTFIRDSKGIKEVRTRVTENKSLVSILNALKLSRQELEEAVSTTYTIEKKASNFIHSSATEATGDAQAGYLIQSYYDGINIASQRPTGRITSYNKQWPGVVQRWIIYNGINNHNATGATLVLEYASVNEQLSRGPLKFVPGSSFSYNQSSNTITYNSQVPCEAWAVTEESPARFKQHQTESIYTVINGALVLKT